GAFGCAAGWGGCVFGCAAGFRGPPPLAMVGRPVGAKTKRSSIHDHGVALRHFFNVSLKNFSVSRVVEVFASPPHPCPSSGTSTSFTVDPTSFSFSANRRDCSIGTIQSLVP